MCGFGSVSYFDGQRMDACLFVLDVRAKGVLGQATFFAKPVFYSICSSAS